MLSQEQLTAIETGLNERMLGKLRMRWPKSGAYIPPGGSRVHVVAPLLGQDAHDFDVYLTAYRDAIADFMNMLNPEQAQLERIVTRMPPHMIRDMDCQPDMARSKKRPGRSKPAPDRAARRDSAARRRLEELFKGGSDG